MSTENGGQDGATRAEVPGPIPEASESTAMGGRVIGIIVVLLVMGAVVALLLPAVECSREAARRAACLNNLKQLGLGFQNHESALSRFPPSCHVKKDEQGNIVSMDGWSWTVDLLPYMENRAVYDTLDIDEGTPLDNLGNPNHPHTVALGTVVPELHCPSYDGTTHIDPTTEAEAITNYKALGATHLESLNVASMNPTVPRYGEVADHPDGGIFPGSRHGVDGFRKDGTSFTVVVVESAEQNVARWTVGTETCVVGLPPMVKFTEKFADPPESAYHHPTGYTPNAFFDESTIRPENNVTYLNLDYTATAYDDGGVSTPSTAASEPIRLGPSSDHSGVTNHLYADGSVHAISNSIDAAAYMFIITRNGHDPAPGIK